MSTRNIIITGAASGIGLAIAHRFGDSPQHRIIALDANAWALSSLQQEWRGQAALDAHVIDISDLPAVQTLMRRIERDCGSVHVLVNSAGVCDENEPEDIDTWHRVININLNGTFYITSLVQRAMIDGGRIINVSSILGRAGKVRNTAYCASKHGMVGMSKALALDLAPRRITVNAILPAWVDTPMLQRELAAQASIAGSELAQLMRNAKKKLPLRRFIGCEEVAAMAAYLASDEAAAVTAQSFVIDGGAGLGM